MNSNYYGDRFYDNYASSLFETSTYTMVGSVTPRRTGRVVPDGFLGDILDQVITNSLPSSLVHILPSILPPFPDRVNEKREAKFAHAPNIPQMALETWQKTSKKQVTDTHRTGQVEVETKTVIDSDEVEIVEETEVEAFVDVVEEEVAIELGPLETIAVARSMVLDEEELEDTEIGEAPLRAEQEAIQVAATEMEAAVKAELEASAYAAVEAAARLESEAAAIAAAELAAQEEAEQTAISAAKAQAEAVALAVAEAAAKAQAEATASAAAEAAAQAEVIATAAAEAAAKAKEEATAIAISEIEEHLKLQIETEKAEKDAIRRKKRRKRRRNRKKH